MDLLGKEFLIDLWRDMCNLPSLIDEVGILKPISDNLYNQLKQLEWSSEFEQLMRNRLIMGYFRYGPFNKQNRSTKLVLESIIRRTNEYLETGNDELLVDIANLCMKEFVTGNHKNKHFKSVDDGVHV
jgi:hypothetical protein